MNHTISLHDQDSTAHYARILYYKHFDGAEFTVLNSINFQSLIKGTPKERHSHTLNADGIKTMNSVNDKISKYINENFTVTHVYVKDNAFYSDKVLTEKVVYRDAYFVIADGIINVSVHRSSASLKSYSNNAIKGIDKLEQFIAGLQIPLDIAGSGIHIIKKTPNGFASVEKRFNDNNKALSYDFYNDDFKPVSEKILSAISTTGSGLILLHGGVGTGKTSYIKHIMSEAKRTVFYVPPDMVHVLSDPAIVDFILDSLQDSILIIEDAENVLKTREADGNQAVSNILNLSNGILGDILRTTIICTFNCPMEHVDKALKRPGRLIASYEFKSLTLDKTNALLDQLYDGKITSNKDMSLAEIFNQKDMPLITGSKKRGVGFVDYPV
jgi:hypothetical protein